MEGLEHMIAPKHPKNLLFKETAEGLERGFVISNSQQQPNHW